MKEIKEILKVLAGMILGFLGIIFLSAGVIGVIMLFLNFTIRDFIVTMFALGIGIIFVQVAKFSAESEKRKILVTSLFISLGFFLWLLGILASFVNFEEKILIPGIFILGVIIFILGFFIFLKEFKKLPINEGKILGVKERNPFLVLIFSILSLGIYHLWWLMKTKKELELTGTELPGFLYLINPFTTLYFLYKYFELFSSQIKKDNTPRFWTLLYLVCWPLAVVLIQIELNRVALEVY